MRKEQVDLENQLVHIPDSKTPNGEGDMPTTEVARLAFQDQIEEARESGYLFPSPRKGRAPYMTNLRKVWTTTLKKAGVPYFSLYELRHHADILVMPTVSRELRVFAAWHRFLSSAHQGDSA